MNTRSCLLCGFNRTEKLTFSSFPRKEERKRLWLKRCNLDPTMDVANARLCCKHFKVEDYVTYGRTGFRRLKLDAVPSVFHITSNNDVPRRERSKTSRSMVVPGNYYHTCFICGHTDGNISFHKLPKNEKERKKWLVHFNIDSTDPRVHPSKEIRFCALHFKQTTGPPHRREKRILNDMDISGDIAEEIRRAKNINVENPIVNDADVDADGPIVSVNLHSENEKEKATKRKKHSAIFTRYASNTKFLDIEHATPRNKRIMQISRRCIRDQKKKIASLQAGLQRAKKKIKIMQGILEYLNQANFLYKKTEKMKN